MPFSPKSWQNGSGGATPLSAAALIDLETRLSSYTDAQTTGVPTAAQKLALSGTNGSPSDTNRYVTDSDPRNTNARTPTSHASTHAFAGSDPVTVTSTMIEAQQAWQTIALAGFSAANLSYYKDSLGAVHFRGDALTAASPGAGATLCTLPAGYRPGLTIYLPIVITNAQGASTISIDASGVVKTISALGTNLWSFGACHFRAEN